MIFDHMFQQLELITEDTGFHVVIIAEMSVPQVGVYLQAAIPARSDRNPMGRVQYCATQGGPQRLGLLEVQFFERFLY